ncbi:hypothetical protein VTH82DRAFT_1343 [Thermothelomyces myriococcoides]
MSRDELSQAAEPSLEPLEEWLDHVNKLKSLEVKMEKRYRELLEMETRYRELLKMYDKKCADLEGETANAKMWRDGHRALEVELSSLKAATDSTPFAYVVIDGDGAIFREDLIAKGEDGGGQAAHELHKQLKAYFHNERLNIDSIFVHVILNIEGLARTLHASGILSVNDHTILTKFSRGFCSAQPLFSFTDVKRGKEQADHKVRKLFEVMERNIQCKCLILGGSHDNGYATFLESFRGNEKIRLLETTPKAAGFGNLPFNCIRFPSVFRMEPLPARPFHAPPSPPRNPIPMVFMNNSNNPSRNEPRAKDAIEERRRGNGNVNLCNKYHLLNGCNKGTSCDYIHGERLPPAEMLALQYRVRYSKFCSARRKCRDVHCIYGHHCPNPKSCSYGDRCNFRETHGNGTDITPTMKVYEDGTHVIIG